MLTIANCVRIIAVNKVLPMKLHLLFNKISTHDFGIFSLVRIPRILVHLDFWSGPQVFVNYQVIYACRIIGHWHIKDYAHRILNNFPDLLALGSVDERTEQMWCIVCRGHEAYCWTQTCCPSTQQSHMPVFPYPIFSLALSIHIFFSWVLMQLEIIF